AAIAHVLANQPAFTSQFIDVVSEPIIFGIEQSFNSLLSICSLIIIHNLAKLSRVETSDRQLNRSFKIKNELNSNSGHSVHFFLIMNHLDSYDPPTQRINKVLKCVPVQFVTTNQSDFFHIHNYFFCFFSCDHGADVCDVPLPFYLHLKNIP